MKLRSVLLGSLAICGTAIAAPANAVTLSCSSSISLVPGATSCAGFFDGNLLSNSPADVTAQTSALSSLGFTFTDFNSYTKLEDVNGASSINFGTPLFGNTIVGIHFGNGSGFGNSTAFYDFNFTSPTSGITLNIPAASGAVLYTTGSAVPEAATWMMALLGFAAIGFAVRRMPNRPKLLQLA